MEDDTNGPAYSEHPDAATLQSALAAGGAIPPTARTRWLWDVVAPFALGVATLASWVGALVLTRATSFSFVALRAAQGAVLLAPALLIPLVAVTITRDYWRASGRGLRNAALSLSLALLVIVVGLAPAFFAVAPGPMSGNITVLLTLPFAAPGFSLGVALGFAWGRLPRPIGASAGLLGGLGFSAPSVVAIITEFVLAKVSPNGVCGGANRASCNPEFALALNVVAAVLLLISDVFAVSLGFIGGVLGAYLRRR